MPKNADKTVDVLIVGSGPTGMGAAWRIEEMKRLGVRSVNDWLLVEQSDQPGGMAASVLDDQGFTWDIGVHVIYSHYAYFNAFLSEVLGDDVLHHTPKSWIWLKDRFIPFPLQRNLQRLPKQDLLACIASFPPAPPQDGSALHFAQWLEQHFGRALCDLFFLPYAFKMWAHPAEQLGVGWTQRKSSSRFQNVQRLGWQALLENLVKEQDAPGWDDAPAFPYPASGGAGGLWQRAFARLPDERVRLGTALTSVDTKDRVATLGDGQRVRYGCLLSSMPMDRFLSCLDEPCQARLPEPALKHSRSHVVGIGLKGPVPEKFADKYWIQVPDMDLPFFRVSLPSNHSPANVPQDGAHWSMACEVSHSPFKPVDESTVVASVIAGLIAAGFLRVEDEIVSTWHRAIPYGYPVPSLDRDAYLAQVHSELMPLGIYSRGRFGGWKYEVSNQDNAFMQGVEAIDNMVLRTEELTYFHPELVCRGLVDRMAAESFLHRPQA